VPASDIVILDTLIVLLTYLLTYSTDFHKIWWKDGTRATEETAICWTLLVLIRITLR